MLRSTWFLMGCAYLAVAALISIILGATTGNGTAIGVGVVVLVTAVALFISGLGDRRQALKRGATAVTSGARRGSAGGNVRLAR